MSNESGTSFQLYSFRWRVMEEENEEIIALGMSGEVCLKYQLPGEDLNALISVTNDEDLEHMMLDFGSNETKSERQWFVDALNSVPDPASRSSSPQTAASETNPNFLFGLDKGLAPASPVKLLPKDYSVRSDPGSEIPYKL
ncbi:hypothetical protein CK203_015117 [Vitis vinifera]|uniref:PB1 domain-containing protein n=1 Tax=Vitis vinifera TaxID=29760 RepID=A0A438JCY4_VITVI|nr:hypothetical protein CK203_015117 [Vitis vinifera]